MCNHNSFIRIKRKNNPTSKHDYCYINTKYITAVCSVSDKDNESFVELSENLEINKNNKVFHCYDSVETIMDKIKHPDKYENEPYVVPEKPEEEIKNNNHELFIDKSLIQNPNISYEEIPMKKKHIIFRTTCTMV